MWVWVHWPEWNKEQYLYVDDHEAHLWALIGLGNLAWAEPLLLVTNNAAGALS